MNILGINAFHGDSSSALLRNGRLATAIEEERFNRMKHWAGLPVLSAKACLDGDQADHIAISRDPRANFANKILRAATHPRSWHRVASRAVNTVHIGRVSDELRAAGIAAKQATVHFVEHHRAHLASAFFCSPFEEYDFSSIMWGIGRENRIEVKGAVHFPHSLGLFYTAFTQFLGFPKYGDEYKMMGLSAYGEPRFARQVRDVVKTEGDQCRLNLDYSTHHAQAST